MSPTVMVIQPGALLARTFLGADMAPAIPILAQRAQWAHRGLIFGLANCKLVALALKDP